MKKNITLFLFLLGSLPALFSQIVGHSTIAKTNVNLRGNPVVVGQVTINAPANGRVVLRFDGHCISAEGDRIILAASENNSVGVNDENVQLEAANSDVNSNTFSHTRSFGVDSGENTFYALAQNDFEMDGNGIASIYGSLTAEWFPIPSAGKAFAIHKGFFYENVFVEGAPIAFNSITFDAPSAGKVLVRFDGKCVSNYGDLMFFAASDTPNWGDYEGSTSNEVIDDDLNHFSFAHARIYTVEPGSHTFYAVAENYYETYGNGFASIYGSLTVEFFPNENPTMPIFQPVSTPFGVNIEGPPVVVGQVSMNAPVSGKVELNFAGTCIGNHGDQIRLAANNEPNLGSDDDNVNFEPYSSDLNRVSFSHTRLFEVAAGDHDFYAVVQNVEEFEGGGLAVVYGSLTARFFPEGIIATEEPDAFSKISISPNPATDFIQIDFAELAREAFTLSLIDTKGRVIRTFDKSDTDFSDQLKWQVSNLAAGMYFIKFTNASGTSVKPLVRN